jgi:hypothetical protein
MLPKFILANCASCLLFGLLFAIAPVGSAAFIGDPPSWVVQITGAVLILNAALLVLTLRGYQDRPIVIWFFVLGDAAWVILTVVLIAFGLWITAIGPAFAVAAMVGFFGFGQWRYGVKFGSAA